MSPYLILLRAEFDCFHSSGSPDPPVPGIWLIALDILSVPLFLTLLPKGVTLCAAIWSPDFPPLLKLKKALFRAIIRKTVAFSNTIQHIEQEGFKNRFFILL